MTNFPISHEAPPKHGARSQDLRGFLDENSDIVTHVDKPVSIDHVGALSAQSEGPILFNSIKEYPDFRMCDILVKHRWSQCRALGVSQEDYLRTLAYRLRQPARGFVAVEDGPVKEIVYKGSEADWTQLPVPVHSAQEVDPYITAMNIVRDPETGFYNSSHAGTSPLKARSGLMSFATPHTHIVMNKYRAMKCKEMPIALVFGLHPAYEIMANYSGLHMDMWGELEMVGTLMAQDVEMVACEEIDLTVPANAEIVVEGVVNIEKFYDYGVVVSPSGYYLPREQRLPEVQVQAITMRRDRPIYRNHQTCPFTDHQVLPRLCHEALLYNRITEIGVPVHDIRFPSWGAALSCVIQIGEPPIKGGVNDALMATMGAPWLNTKMVVAVSEDTNVNSAEDVYHAIATRVNPSRDIFIVDNTRGSPYDPSADPVEGQGIFRNVGKIGIDATRKSHHDQRDFDRSWPKYWGEVSLSDYL